MEWCYLNLQVSKWEHDYYMVVTRQLNVRDSMRGHSPHVMGALVALEMNHVKYLEVEDL
jgi:hypothetical protein